MPVTPLQPGTNPSLFIGPQLADFIGGQPTLAPLVTDANSVVHVHLGYAENTDAPRIVFSMISGPEGDTAALETLGLTDSRWQFECYAPTGAAAGAIADALLTDVLDFHGVLAADGASVDIAEVLDARGPDYDFALKQFRCDVDLLIRF